MSLSGKIIPPDEQAYLPAVRRRDPAPHKPGKALWESNRLEQPGFQLIVGVTASLLTTTQLHTTYTAYTQSQVIPMCTVHLSGSRKTWLFNTHHNIRIYIYLLKNVLYYLRAWNNTLESLCRQSAGEKWSLRSGLSFFFLPGASVKMFDLLAFGVTLWKQTYFHIIKTMTNLSSGARQESHSNPPLFV